MTRLLTAALICATAALPGCGAIGALNKAGRTLDAYELRGELPPARPPAPGGLHLIVEPPVVAASLDTDRILIRPNRLQVQYLPDARWSDPPAKMVQAALVRQLDATGRFGYVGRTPLGAGGDVALISDIIDFEAEVGAGGAVTTRLRVSARLVQESDLRIRAARSFEVSVPARSTDTADLVAAMDAAMTRLVGQMVGWAVASV